MLPDKRLIEVIEYRSQSDILEQRRKQRALRRNELRRKVYHLLNDDQKDKKETTLAK